MNDDLKEKLIESIWNYWYKNNVSWADIFQYLENDFQIGIMRRLESQMKESGINSLEDYNKFFKT